jgi:hypothetical protein
MQAAEQAIAAAARADDRDESAGAAAYGAQILMLAGETRAAEEQFLAADRIDHASDIEGDHLYSVDGAWWTEFLIRTQRIRPARALAERSYAVNEEHGWNAGVARCDRLLGSLDLADGELASAWERVNTAVSLFRDGEYVVDLAITLPLLADCARAAGQFGVADRHVAEALAIAAPRGLIPVQASALTIRARIHADRAAAGEPEHLERGRDAAEIALRLAGRHRLAWHELDALEAHALLDAVGGVEQGWAAKAAALRARLIPAGLDPDPLGTVERQVAAERAGASSENL